MYLWVSYTTTFTVFDLITYSIFERNLNDEGQTFDGNSSSTIKLNNNTVLYLREVNQFLALVCILREDNFEKQGLIDYNFNCFREAIEEVFEANQQSGHHLNHRSHYHHIPLTTEPAPGPSSASPSSPPSTSGYNNNTSSAAKDGGSLGMSPYRGNHHVVVGSAQSNGYAGGSY